MTTQRLRIGILNDSFETLSLLKRWFQAQGHLAWCMRAADMRDPMRDGVGFIRGNRCDVVVFDIGIPYAPTWDVAEALRMMIGEPAVPFVFTSLNVAELAKHVGPTNAFELTGTGANLGQLMDQVTSAVRT